MAGIASIIDDIAGKEESIPGDDETAAASEEVGSGADQGESNKASGAEAEAAAASGAEGEADKEDGAAAEKDRTVPLSALHEARERERELRNELTQQRERMTRMETLFTQLVGQKPKGDGAADEIKIPDMEEDPAGHLAARIEQMQRQLASITEDGKKRQEADQQRSTETQLLESYAAASHAYSQKVPDYRNAYDYLAKSVDAELQARGFTDPAERKAALEYEEGRLVGRMLAQKKDPAEAIYQLAVHRGYKKAAPNGQAAESEEDKLARLTAGAEAGKTLSGGGNTAGGTLTLEALAKLADEDPKRFDAEWEKMRKRGMLG